MKKIRLLIFLIMMIIPVTVRADHIYSIDMDIDISKDGTANITEEWDVKATSGSEWYKTMYNLGDSKISNFVVYMDGEKLIYDSNWDVSASISQKSGYYGINYTSDGMELCFGKSDMKEHTFILKYTLSNYIFNTNDSQVLYWTLLPRITVDYFSVDVTSYYDFPDTLDVWGYGYKGYAYVEDGKIKMSEDRGLSDDYVVLLVKFSRNTFKTNYTLSEFNTFDDVLKIAEQGTYEYDYSDDSNNVDIASWIIILCPFVIIIIIFFKSIRVTTEDKYGYINNKKIDKKNVPMFRDIPCDKNIFYANTLIKLNKFGYNKFNIFGAIILKWVKDGKIKFINKEVGIFKKDTSVIDLTMNPKFENGIELSVFEMMYNASNDGILEARELEKWAKYNYNNFLEIFNTSENRYINYLKDKSHIYKRINRKDCKQKNVMDDKIYNDSVQLYGLKKYLEEFSRMDTKEVMDVKLWDEYLMFAYLFGIADKVAKQLKDLYPEILVQNNVDYDVIQFVDKISTRSISFANSAKSREHFRDSLRNSARSGASSYSSGGGGFSSGGGGRGSSGGGGSMGGR